MSFYERIDRHASSRKRATPEYYLIYAVCFVLLLIPVAMRRLNPSAGGAAGGRASIIAETNAMASICAASSFAGM